MVDAGNMLAPSLFVNSAERWQRQVKAELLLEAVSTIGIDAMTVGDADFAFGKDFLIAQAKTLNLPYVCANLVDSATGQAVFPPSLMKEVGPIKIGVIGLTQESLEVDGLKSTDPVEAARTAAADLKKQGAELIVALSNQKFGVNEKLAREVPEIEVIVAGATRQKHESPKREADALLLEAGNRGKFIGVLDLTLVPGASGWKDVGSDRRNEDRLTRYRERIRALEARIARSGDAGEKERLNRQLEFYRTEIARDTGSSAKPAGLANIFTNRHVSLEKDLPDEPKVKALIDKALVKISNPPPADTTAAVDPANTAGSAATLVATSGAAQPGRFGNFVGAQACMGCHMAEYKQWVTTPHAHAYATLEKDKRHLDFQCYGCHVTGHGAPGGPSHPAEIGNLANVQCESCHTAGREHIQNPTANKLPAKVSQDVCLSCHTKEQTDDRFVYADYLPKVVHTATASTAPAGSAASPGGH